jgi:hypothetical protein
MQDDKPATLTTDRLAELVEWKRNIMQGATVGFIVGVALLALYIAARFG